jgi:hypothetical protein
MTLQTRLMFLQPYSNCFNFGSFKGRVWCKMIFYPNIIQYNLNLPPYFTFLYCALVKIRGCCGFQLTGPLDEVVRATKPPEAAANQPHTVRFITRGLQFHHPAQAICRVRSCRGNCGGTSTARAGNWNSAIYSKFIIKCNVKFNKS